MKIAEIAIHADDRTGDSYKIVGEITAKVSKGSLLSKSPTIEDVNFKLQEQASKLGANAVINVTYSRGMSLMSYEVLKAVGTGVLVESDEVSCPLCAETIKRAAKKCKHCGSDLTTRQRLHSDAKCPTAKAEFGVRTFDAERSCPAACQSAAGVGVARGCAQQRSAMALDSRKVRRKMGQEGIAAAPEIQLADALFRQEDGTALSAKKKRNHLVN